MGRTPLDAEVRLASDKATNPPRFRHRRSDLAHVASSIDKHIDAGGPLVAPQHPLLTRERAHQST